MKAHGFIGSGRLGLDGDPCPLILGRDANLLYTRCHGRNLENTFRNQTYSVSGTSAPGTTFGTSPNIYIHNPIGSGIVVSLVSASLAYVSGTTGTGAVYLVTHIGKPVVKPAGGTQVFPMSCFVGGDTISRVYAQTSGNSTAALIAIRPIFNIGAEIAASAPGLSLPTFRFNGSLVLKPGYGCGLASLAAAGSSSVLRYAMAWEEIPLTL